MIPRYPTNYYNKNSVYDRYDKYDDEEDYDDDKSMTTVHSDDSKRRRKNNKNYISVKIFKYIDKRIKESGFDTFIDLVEKNQIDTTELANQICDLRTEIRKKLLKHGSEAARFAHEKGYRGKEKREVKSKYYEKLKDRVKFLCEQGTLFLLKEISNLF